MPSQQGLSFLQGQSSAFRRVAAALNWGEGDFVVRLSPKHGMSDSMEDRQNRAVLLLDFVAAISGVFCFAWGAMPLSLQVFMGWGAVFSPKRGSNELGAC